MMLKGKYFLKLTFLGKYLNQPHKDFRDFNHANKTANVCKFHIKQKAFF